MTKKVALPVRSGDPETSHNKANKQQHREYVLRAMRSLRHDVSDDEIEHHVRYVQRKVASGSSLRTRRSELVHEGICEHAAWSLNQFGHKCRTWRIVP